MTKRQKDKTTTWQKTTWQKDIVTKRRKDKEIKRQKKYKNKKRQKTKTKKRVSYWDVGAVSHSCDVFSTLILFLVSSVSFGTLAPLLWELHNYPVIEKKLLLLSLFLSPLSVSFTFSFSRQAIWKCDVIFADDLFNISPNLTFIPRNSACFGKIFRFRFMMPPDLP